MRSLGDSLDTYLRLRRGLGAVMRAPEATLRRFVAFAEAEGASVITTDLALRFATERASTSLSWRAKMLGDVRRFAVFCSVTDSRIEIPPRGLLPERYRRCQPYIYSDEEIARVVDAASCLPSPVGLRGATCATLFGLLASTGLRLGEALGLDRADVDLGSGLLAIRRAKFGKSRLVPMHDTTALALARYGCRRDQVLPRPASPAFFLNERGVRLNQYTARDNFVVASRAMGLRRRTKTRFGHGPRLHDMRHTLAARVLISWYRKGRDVERELPRLSAYLGHVHVADTYWYLEAVPELLQLATERAARPPLPAQEVLP